LLIIELIETYQNINVFDFRSKWTAGLASISLRGFQLKLITLHLVQVGFRFRRSLSAGTAPTNFGGGATKVDFSLVLFLQECRAFHSNQLVFSTLISRWTLLVAYGCNEG
jgi:hypothetical protein